MMIRPVSFRRNEETSDNFYQQSLPGISASDIQSRAQGEFDGFVAKLRAKGVAVVVVDDTAEPSTPDSIFPNNWISFHENGSVILYPMYAENRRQERRPDIIDNLRSEFIVNAVESLAEHEESGEFLEGTGSIILDRTNKIGYAAISERTNETLFIEFCEQKELEPITFHAFQTVGQDRLPIYHTNVMMCVGEHFALVCSDSIDSLEERERVLDRLRASGKEIIQTTEYQNNRFAGNMLQVKNKKDQRFIVMSSAAYTSLDSGQIEKLENHGEIIHSDINTIETLGGGSARCMMAEVFLPKKK